MTNTQKIELAVADFAGKVLSAKEIQALVMENFPETKLGSILPSDHAGANPKSGTVYSDQLFERVGNGYKVLASDAIVRKPKAARTGRGVSLVDALASAKAKLEVEKKEEEKEEEKEEQIEGSVSEEEQVA